LPCGGCKHCSQVHEKCQDFTKIDDVIPLAAVRVAKIDKMVHFLEKRSSEWLCGKDMDVVCSEVQDLAYSDNQELITESTESKVGLNITKVDDGSAYGLSYTPDQLTKAQENDSDLNLIRSCLQTKVEPQDTILVLASPAAKTYVINKEQVFLDENRILWNRSKSSTVRLILPKGCKQEAMRLNHYLIMTGHEGIDRTRHAKSVTDLKKQQGSQNVHSIMFMQVQR
jgi:hypothetical protein